MIQLLAVRMATLTMIVVLKMLRLPNVVVDILWFEMGFYVKELNSSKQNASIAVQLFRYQVHRFTALMSLGSQETLRI